MGQRNVFSQIYGDPLLPETTQFRAELGQVYNSGDGRRWQKVQMEAAPQGTPLVGQCLFWKDRSKMIVTNKLANSDGDRNACAGWIAADATPPTANQYFWAMQEGQGVSVLCSAATYLAGQDLFPFSGTAADLLNIALGTASTYNPVGQIKTGVVNGSSLLTVCNVNVPSLLF